MKEQNPLDIECVFCGAAPGQPCVNLSDYTRIDGRQYHFSRIDVTRKPEAALRHYWTVTNVEQSPLARFLIRLAMWVDNVPSVGSR